MNLYVADTHALYWYLTASPRLSNAARAAFDEGVRGEALIYVPAIVLAELYYLNVTTQPCAREGHVRRTQCRCDNPEFFWVGMLPEALWTVVQRERLSSNT